MDWTMLGAIGELVGATAVVLSLLYVGRQVQHNTAMARSSVRHELGSEANAFALAIASEPTLAAGLAKVHFHGLTREEATEQERLQIGYVLVAFLGQMNLAYQEAADGVLSVEELGELYSQGSPLLELPYLKSFWPILRSNYGESFATWLETRYDLIDSGDPPAG